MEAPEEDTQILEEVLEQYQQSKAAARKRKAAKAPDPKRRSITPLDAGSPRPVGFTIDDSEPAAERLGFTEAEGTPRENEIIAPPCENNLEETMNVEAMPVSEAS